MKKYLLATSAFSNCDLLKKCVESWPKDKENVDKIVIFDGKSWKNVFQEFLSDENILNQLNSYLYADDHIGASGSWNKILKYGFIENNYNNIIIVGSDIEMKEGFFEDFINSLEEVNPDFSCCMGFNCFVMNKKCYDMVGEMDCGYFPCYFEDNDYSIRIRLAKDTLLYHNVGREELLNHFGSATIRKNENYNRANGVTFSINRAYHIKKWGCTVENPDENKYLTPFNDPNLTIKDWTLNKEEYLYKKMIWENVNK